jgi:hypothetical protein
MDLSEEIKTKIISECVKRWEQEFDDSVYNECLEVVKQTVLRNIPNLESTIKRFLYVWGRMGRVLGRHEYRNWEKNIAKQIESNCEKLKEFRMRNLKSADLDRSEFDIKKCYASFKEAVGSIAAVKILHLICPNFFPLWDNTIADAVREERVDKKAEKFSAEDYYRFMQATQDFVKKYDRVLSELANRYRRGKLRILDEFLWWMTHRPLSLFSA